MFAYIWFCVMLRVVAPGADVMIARHNAAIEAFMTAGLIEQPREPISTRFAALR